MYFILGISWHVLKLYICELHVQHVIVFEIYRLRCPRPCISPTPLNPSVHYGLMFDGFLGWGLNQVLMMLKDASVSNSSTTDCCNICTCDQRNRSLIFVKSTEIRLYLPFFDWFSSKIMEKWWIQSYCIYHFPMDLEPNGRPFSFKSIGNW